MIQIVFMRSILLACIGISSLFANSKEIILNMGEVGSSYPPYFIFDEGKPSGIMFDVLFFIAKKSDYTVSVTHLPKNRVAGLLKAGKVNATGQAPEWTKEANQFEFTDVVMEIRDVIFSHIDNPHSFSTFDEMIGKTAITHLGYHYPIFDVYFDNNQIKRYDTVDERAMLGMVMKKRGDFTIINELVAKRTLAKYNWIKSFKMAKIHSKNIGYRFMFSKEWRHFVKFFNKELIKMKKNGTLRKIVEKYVSEESSDYSYF